MGVKLAEAKIKNVSLKVEEGAEDKLQFTIEYGRENFDGLAILAKAIKNMMGRKTVFSLDLLQQELDLEESDEQPEQLELHLPLREGPIEGCEGMNWADPINLEGLEAVLDSQQLHVESRADGQNGHSTMVIGRGDDKTALVSLEEFTKDEAERWSWARFMAHLDQQYLAEKAPVREGAIPNFGEGCEGGAAKNWEDAAHPYQWPAFLTSQGFGIEGFLEDTQIAKIAKDGGPYIKVSVAAAYAEEPPTWAAFLSDIEAQMELMAGAHQALEDLPVEGVEPQEEAA